MRTLAIGLPGAARRLLVTLAIALALSGCVPRPTSGPPAFTYADSYAAISLYFGPYGPNVVRCANGIVDHESGHYPYSRNGQYLGIMQLHPGFQGSINAIAAARHETPSFFNPYQNAWAAAQAFLHYGSFHVNWASTVPAGCP